jgi:hypothetical protein
LSFTVTARSPQHHWASSWGAIEYSRLDVRPLTDAV